MEMMSCLRIEESVETHLEVLTTALPDPESLGTRSDYPTPTCHRSKEARNGQFRPDKPNHIRREARHFL